jgi:hypothetical protein
MHTSLKLSAYGAALAVVVAGTYALGSAVGPPPRPAADSTHTAPADPEAHAHPAAPGVAGPTAGAEPAGLAVSRGGYTLVPDDPTLGSGTFAFRVTGPDGAPVTAFDVAHDKRLHLIVVRRDGADFRHLHPEMDASGTWRVPLTVASGGAYRAFADFTPTGGEPTTLGVDLFAPGEFTPVTHPERRTATVDGYTVSLAGGLVPGTASPLTLTVTRDGAPVTGLQPYLGAYGHLVALRQGDLAYLHVHPDGHPGDGVTPPGPGIGFTAEVPTAGTYRLFLDFQVDGVVRTADLTVPTAAGSGS